VYGNEHRKKQREKIVMRMVTFLLVGKDEGDYKSFNVNTIFSVENSMYEGRSIVEFTNGNKIYVDGDRQNIVATINDASAKG